MLIRRKECLKHQLYIFLNDTRYTLKDSFTWNEMSKIAVVVYF